jgi:hypothetical protein
MRKNTTYEIVDLLHVGRAARVHGDRIAAVVSSWLSELGADSPMTEDLARAVRAHDWPKAHAIGECLSVDVMVAA